MDGLAAAAGNQNGNGETDVTLAVKDMKGAVVKGGLGFGVVDGILQFAIPEAGLGKVGGE